MFVSLYFADATPANCILLFDSFKRHYFQFPLHFQLPGAEYGADIGC